MSNSVTVNIVDNSTFEYKGYIIHLSVDESNILEYCIELYDTYPYFTINDLKDAVRCIDEIIRIKNLPIGTQLNDKFIIKSFDGVHINNAIEDENYASKALIVSFISLEK